MISFLIPSRNEPYLQHTIDSLFENAETDIEVIVGLDGFHEKQPKHQDNVKVIHKHTPIGQRAMTNRLAEEATKEWLVKVDAHCAFGPGFDTALLKHADKDIIQTPILARLHAFNWKCTMCGLESRQDTKPTCHDALEKRTVWEVEPKPFTKKYYFDTNFVFQYDPDQSQSGPLVETMTLQGSFVMMHKDVFKELNPFDDAVGSWGCSGVEIACKGWFSGRRVVTNTDTYYAHMFRTSDIPYNRPIEEVEKTYQGVRRMFRGKDIAWLVEKFDYPGDWSVEKALDIKKHGII